MSGIFLIVWDEQFNEKSFVLRSTKGGYPHLTIAYTGNHVSKDQLIKTASQVLIDWSLKKVTLQKSIHQ